jgi:hypothetical protein
MIAEFVKSLEQAGLTQTGGDLTATQSGLTGREIAEALYLALYVSPTGAPPAAAEELETAQPTEPQQSKPDSTVTPATHEPDRDPVSVATPQEGDLFTPQAGKSAEGGISALPYRAAAAIALPGAAEIARALRPLSRRFPSRTRREIDVERTVQQIADGGPYAPVERPAPERWLDVALVVDEGASMRVWRPTISELQRLLERHGAFRDVSVWGISADDGQVRFYRETGMAAPPTRLANPGELFDPYGRRLIVLVSDCIGQGWRTGAAFRLLAEWGERNPVVLAQVLPQRLWAGTALPPLGVELRASAPGIANKRLHPQQGWLTEPSASYGLPLPVVTFDDWSLAPWAQMVAARGEASAAGVLIPDWLTSPTPLLDEADEEGDVAPNLTEEQRAKQIVARFRASASPMAFQLACYLAAVELTMPVMRLVQQAMLPQSRQIHLAEVFLGGLLRQPKAKERQLQRPEEIYYDFHPGVRKVLLDLAPKSETKRVMAEVWRLIEQRSPYADDFKVLVTNPGIASEQQIAPGRRAFATISPEAIAKVEGGRPKEQNSTKDAMLRRAFRLSYFIHGDREFAVRIATAAMFKLNAAAAARDKRSYYRTGGRSRASGSKVIGPRTKVSLSELHLLQRLVYVESEPHERQEEQRQSATIDEEILITRYIKHLINITLMRNSFHVTLGVSRLLYNYTTAESMKLYDLIMQNPERAKDDAYWREREARLRRELKDRFGQSLAVVRGPHGEERFQTREDSARYQGLVKQCLQMFTPWDTPCPLPSAVPVPGEIEALTFRGSDPDEEHQIEVARMHAVIHPDCYERLVIGLGLDSSAKRLEIPKFFHNSDYGPEDGPRDNSDEAAELTEDELARIRSELEDQPGHYVN